jgi:hypothetical protein
MNDSSFPLASEVSAPDLVRRSLSYTSSPVLSEYLEQTPDDGHLVHLRLSEVRLPPEAQAYFSAYTEVVNLIALVSDLLPDRVGVLPLWWRIAEQCPRADIRVLTELDRDRLELLMGDEGLAELASLELPQLLILDDEWHLQAQWGPRSVAADALLERWVSVHPDYEVLAEAEDSQSLEELARLNRVLAIDMRIWHNSGLDAETSTEIQALLASLLEEA